MAQQSKGKNASGYTEDWLPVRGIQNNMIITRDNYKVTGVKITPRNIFILDYSTQENICFCLLPKIFHRFAVKI